MPRNTTREATKHNPEEKCWFLPNGFGLGGFCPCSVVWFCLSFVGLFRSIPANKTYLGSHEEGPKPEKPETPKKTQGTHEEGPQTGKNKEKEKEKKLAKNRVLMKKGPKPKRTEN